MKKLYYSALTASLGGLLFGFDTAVISGAEKSIQKVFELSNFSHGFTVSSALIGTIIGALIAGYPAQKFGRKYSLILISILYLISAIGSAISSDWILFIIFRFIGGIGVGSSSVIGPMYIAEISPSDKRGRLVAFFQFSIVLGILLSYISNYLININISNNSWRYMLGVEAIPAIIFLALLSSIPNSPRWLIINGKENIAKKAMLQLNFSDIELSIKNIKDSICVNNSKTILFSRTFSKPLTLAFLIALFNQFTGINAIMYYAPRIFETAGLSLTSALQQSIFIGLLNILSTTAALFFIDKVGRKKLLLIGSIGMSLALFTVFFIFSSKSGNSFLTVSGLLSFIIFFAFSQGAVIWVYISEIFPNRVRSMGQSFGSSVHWILAAFISWTFPIIASNNKEGTSYAFLIFSIFMIIQFIVVKKYFPETKNRSLEEIQDEMIKK